jgi:hypothetical protein
MPQIIGSSGQTVNAVGQSTMAVHASVVRAVGALTAAAGATPLIRAAERSVYADTITLAATDGVIVGNGTVDLPTIASQDEDPQAFLISAVGGAITVVPHEDDEAIFGLDNQLVSEVTVEANTVLTLLRYVGVWRVIDSSAASLALGETSSTAYRGDRGKTAYDHSQLVTGTRTAPPQPMSAPTPQAPRPGWLMTCRVCRTRRPPARTSDSVPRRRRRLATLLLRRTPTPVLRCRWMRRGSTATSPRRMTRCRKSLRKRQHRRADGRQRRRHRHPHRVRRRRQRHVDRAAHRAADPCPTRADRRGTSRDTHRRAGRRPVARRDP